LGEIWNRNNTSELNSDLNLKYQELRELQKKLSKNWSIWKELQRRKHIRNLQEDTRNLEQRKNALKLKQDKFRNYPPLIALKKDYDLLSIDYEEILKKKKEIQNELKREEEKYNLQLQ